MARSHESHIGMLLAGALLALPGPAGAQALRPYAVVGDAIPESLTGCARRRDARARARRRTFQHLHPLPQRPISRTEVSGRPGADLAGSGSRWSEGQLRLRLVDASRLNAATIMPSYYRVDGLDRVGTPWRGKPILSAEQIEDIVAYLVTLRE